MSGPVTTYDFTMSFEAIDREELKKWLKEYCKTWCFQLEEGEETGYEHYQGRFALKVKERITGVIKKFPKGGHLSVTSTANRDNNFYVMKEDTRVDGPWSDKDVERYIPWDIRAIKSLRPWQRTLNDLMIIKTNIRNIDIIIDIEGNNGKTTFTRWFCCHGYGMQVPFINENKDLMRLVMDMPKLGAYIIDMPRCMKKDKLLGIYAAIEQIKGGYCWDDRYSFKYEYFDPPNICVFTNEMPDLSYLSRDRWRLWEIKNNELVKFNVGEGF